MELRDNQSFMVDPICLAFDAPPARDRASIVAAGYTAGRATAFRDRGVSARHGVVAEEGRCRSVGKQHVYSVSCDPRSPAAALVRPLEGPGIQWRRSAARIMRRRVARSTTSSRRRRCRHLGTDELAAAVKNAATRPLGDSWAWSRKNSAADISPLVAATLAVWQASSKLTSVYDDRGVIAI